MIKTIRLRSRTLPILAGVGCFAVIVCAATFWEDIVARYHLHRFRGEPGYLGLILEEPEGTAARVAVRKYLESKEGNDNLLRVVLGWHPDALAAMQKPKTKQVMIEVDPGANPTCYYVWRGQKGGSVVREVYGSPQVVVPPSIIQAIQELSKIDPPWTLLPEHPDVRFLLTRRGLGYNCTIDTPTPGIDPFNTPVRQ